MIVAEAKVVPAQALRDVEAMLRDVGAGLPVSRGAAVRYGECRAALLDSPLRPALPGFLIQCVSLSKFQDFITLYHPMAEARAAFVSEAFFDCRASHHSRRAHDAFGDDQF